MAEGNGQNGTRLNGGARWAGVLVAVVLAAGAMTVQWGVVTTKLQQVAKRLDEFIGEARSIRADYQAMNAVYAEYMPDPPPVRTTVQAGLGKGMLVEIDVIALAG